MTELEGLPASDTVRRGLRDLASGEHTTEALLVAIAAERLTELGLPLPPKGNLPGEPEIALYRRLGECSEDPFFAYRSMVLELDSFIAGLQARRTAASNPSPDLSRGA